MTVISRAETADDASCRLAGVVPSEPFEAALEKYTVGEAVVKDRWASKEVPALFCATVR